MFNGVINLPMSIQTILNITSIVASQMAADCRACCNAQYVWIVEMCIINGGNNKYSKNKRTVALIAENWLEFSLSQIFVYNI